MDYAKHYDKLIHRARIRPALVGYSERHHIVPKCLGGHDTPDNLVRLTAEEHFLAHQLLVKMHPGNHKLMWAAVGMTNGTSRQRRGNKLYGWLRRKFGQRMREMRTGTRMSPESCAKMSLYRRGKKRKPHTAETKAKMSAAAKGRPRSATHCANLSKAKLGRKLPPRSTQWRINQAEAIRRAMKTAKKDHFADPSYRQNQAEQMRRVWQERKKAKATHT